MHEISLCMSIRDILCAQAQEHHLSRITSVRLEIGRFACVEKAALEFAWDVVMRGSPAEGANLVMLDVPGLAGCLDCGREVEIMEGIAPCPECGGCRLLPRGGDRMRIKDLEAV